MLLRPTALVGNVVRYSLNLRYPTIFSIDCKTIVVSHMDNIVTKFNVKDTEFISEDYIKYYRHKSECGNVDVMVGVGYKEHIAWSNIIITEGLLKKELIIVSGWRKNLQDITMEYM